MRQSRTQAGLRAFSETKVWARRRPSLDDHLMRCGSIRWTGVWSARKGRCSHGFGVVKCMRKKQFQTASLIVRCSVGLRASEKGAELLFSALFESGPSRNSTRSYPTQTIKTVSEFETKKRGEKPLPTMRLREGGLSEVDIWSLFDQGHSTKLGVWHCLSPKSKSKFFLCHQIISQYASVSQLAYWSWKEQELSLDANELLWDCPRYQA
ncbi:hypothetical protein BDZ45DRAFT_406425 [Acephala macrosclerotiorum]|nr:hypothetical protein BDZ45DRAFT_406425 [Acephala macrosclerotiorum]